MEIDISWYLPRRILYTYDAVSAEAMLDRNRRLLKLIEAEGLAPAVHVIIDYSQTPPEAYSKGLAYFVERARSSDEFVRVREELVTHPLFGWVVAFGEPSALVDVGGSVMATKNRYRRHSADTLEDGLRFLKLIDPTLQDVL